ncbi:MAG: aminopeptidase P N-terminal domain-containing protein [Oscillospiraceae bacterium]|nr:aminopeptidase P N-terminal domain-containing protein [Oscillospiraceae bacterium]
MSNTEFYANRRKRLAETMADNSFYFVCSGNMVESTDDANYIFQPCRNFVYLTGRKDVDATLVISKINGTVSETLFMHIPTEKELRWIGTRFDAEEIKTETGIASLVPNKNWDSFISRMMFYNDVQTVYIDLARHNMNYPANEAQKRANRLKEIYPFLTIRNAYHTVCKMRSVKDATEIAAHRKAAAITEEAVKNILANMKPGMTESHIEAYYDFVLKKHGCKFPAFTTIAATGKNACIMHYDHNDTETKDGEMILFDLGAQWDLYCTDVSRTYPVNGRFTEKQKMLYNVVLKGLEVAESLSKPGQLKSELQQISKKVMAEELVKIGYIEKEEDINKHYMHGSGHFIGLDVHDVGDYNDIVLAEDMMFTLEPGLYFDDEKLGIRIEDTILVTKDGCEVLSGGIPKTVEEIEAFMAKSEN